MLGSLAGLGHRLLTRHRLDLGDGLAGDGCVVGIAIESDEVAAEAMRDGSWVSL